MKKVIKMYLVWSVWGDKRSVYTRSYIGFCEKGVGALFDIPPRCRVVYILISDKKTPNSIKLHDLQGSFIRIGGRTRRTHLILNSARWIESLLRQSKNNRLYVSVEVD